MAAYLGQTLNKNNCQAANEKTRTALGCFGDLPEYQQMEILGVEVRGCAYCQVMQTPLVFSYLKLYKFFKMGHLPTDDGLIHQHPATMDAFDILETVEERKEHGRQSATD